MSLTDSNITLKLFSQSGSSLSAPSAATAAISGGSGSGNANLSIVTSGGSGGPVGGGLKEGSPAASAVSPASAGFHGGKQPFRGQGTRGGGRGKVFKSHQTCSCSLIQYFGTLFWDDITIFWDEKYYDF